jgi:hypothetical protein
MFLGRFGQRARLDSFGNFTENTLARIALLPAPSLSHHLLRRSLH